MSNLIRLLFVALLLSFATPTNAQIGGGIDTGVSRRVVRYATPPTCTSVLKGFQYYDTDDNLFYGCNGSSWSSQAAGAGSSSDGQVLFNSSGVITGDGGLTYNSGSDILTVVTLVGSGTITGFTNIVINNPSIDQTIQPSADKTFIVKQANTSNTVNIFEVQLKNATKAFYIDSSGGWNSDISGAGYFQFTTGALAVGAASTVKIGAHTGNLFAFSENGNAIETVSATKSVSTAIGEEKTNDAATDKDYTSLFTIPASYLTAGRCIRVSLLYEITTGTSSVTLTRYLKFGSTKTFTSLGQNFADGTTDLNEWEVYMICGTTTAGAAAATYTSIVSNAANGSVTFNQTAQPVNLATNGTLAIIPGVTYSGTGSTETIRLQVAIVEKIN